MSNNLSVMLVGVGYMGKEYYKILSNLNVDIIVVGRGKAGTDSFSKLTNCPAIPGGLPERLNGLKPCRMLLLLR